MAKEDNHQNSELLIKFLEHERYNSNKPTPTTKDNQRSK